MADQAPPLGHTPRRPRDELARAVDGGSALTIVKSETLPGGTAWDSVRSRTLPVYVQEVVCGHGAAEGERGGSAAFRWSGQHSSCRHGSRYPATVFRLGLGRIEPTVSGWDCTI